MRTAQKSSLYYRNGFVCLQRGNRNLADRRIAYEGGIEKYFAAEAKKPRFPRDSNFMLKP